MGTKMAPSYANLFVGYFEANALENALFQLHTWLSYIDDIFMIWFEGLDNLKIFTTSKFECSNHLLKASCQKEFCFSPANLIVFQSRPKALKNLSVFRHNQIWWKVIIDLLQTTEDKKMWNDRTKNYSRRKKYFKIKNSYTRFCCLYVKVATIQANFRANEQNPVDL